MSLHKLNSTEFSNDEKVQKSFRQFENLLDELDKREIPDVLEQEINSLVEEVNAAASKKEFKKCLQKNRNKVIKLVEKRLKLVPKSYYQTMWMALGMSVFGLPMGIAFSASLDSYAYIGIGLPIGMIIGMAVGAEKDKKAFEEGRQLDLDGQS